MGDIPISWQSEHYSVDIIVSLICIEKKCIICFVGNSYATLKFIFCTADLCISLSAFFIVIMFWTPRIFFD